MSSAVPPNDLLARESYVDWDDLAGLDKIAAIYQVGTNTIVVETTGNREVKITAWVDRRTGQYVAAFEKRCTIGSGGQQLRVWAHTPAYAKCVPTISSVASKQRSSRSTASPFTDGGGPRERAPI